MKRILALLLALVSTVQAQRTISPILGGGGGGGGIASNAIASISGHGSNTVLHASDNANVALTILGNNTNAFKLPTTGITLSSGMVLGINTDGGVFPVTPVSSSGSNYGFNLSQFATIPGGTNWAIKTGATFTNINMAGDWTWTGTLSMSNGIVSGDTNFIIISEVGMGGTGLWTLYGQGSTAAVSWGTNSLSTLMKDGRAIITGQNSAFNALTVIGSTTNGVVNNGGIVSNWFGVWHGALTASRIIGTDANKLEQSITPSTGLLLSGTALALDINALTADATPDGTADYVLTWDASAGAHKKVLLNNLPTGGGGEVNTGANLGGGYPTFENKSGVTLRFNTFTNGSGITVVSNANTFTWSIATAGVTSAMLRDSAALSIIGRSANSIGVPADIVAASDFQVLRRSGATIGFGAIDISQGAATTGILPFGSGGTGISSTPTANSILIGNGSVYVVTAVRNFNGILLTNTPGTGLDFAVDPNLIISNLTANGYVKQTSYAPALADIDWNRGIYSLDIVVNTNLTFSNIASDRGVTLYMTNRGTFTLGFPSYIYWPFTFDRGAPGLESNAVTIVRVEKIGSSGFTNAYVIGAPQRIGTMSLDTNIVAGIIAMGTAGSAYQYRTAVAGTDYTSPTSTETPLNKLFDAAGAGNTLKTKGYIPLQGFGNVTGVTVPNTNDLTLNTFMNVQFSNSADQAANYVEWRILAPADWDTTVDPRAKIAFKLTGADTGTHRYVLSVASVAASAAYAGTVGTAINLDFGGDASGASLDFESVGYTTLTGWGAAVTAGNLLVVRLARDGDAAQDASTVDSMLLEVNLEYGSTQ